jgi:hypothetical protein
MKKQIICAFASFFLTLFIAAYSFAQTVFCDARGYARTYAANAEDAVIYQFDGTPLAYFKPLDEGACIYDFDGVFKGWYINSVFYNKEGLQVFVDQATVRGNNKKTPDLSLQKPAPTKPDKEEAVPNVIPDLQTRWLTVPMVVFLRGTR